MDFANKHRQPNQPLQWHSYSKDAKRAALPCRDDTFAAVRSSSTQCTLKFDTSRTGVDAEECVCTSSQLLFQTSRTSTDTVSFSLGDLPCSFLCVAGKICSPERRSPWGAYPCHLPCRVRLSRPCLESCAGGHSGAPCPNSHALDACALPAPAKLLPDSMCRCHHPSCAREAVRSLPVLSLHKMATDPITAREGPLSE